MWQQLSQVLKLTAISFPILGGIQSGFFPVQAMEAQGTEERQNNSPIPTSQINGNTLQGEIDEVNTASKLEQEASLLQYQINIDSDFEGIDLNNLSVPHFEIACNTLKSKSSLKSLCFSLANTDSQKLQESSLQSLVQLLQNKSLETAYLILGDHLAIDAAKTLGSLLAKQPIALKRLLLDIGEDETGEKTTALLEGLENNHSLTQIHFSNLFPIPVEFEMLSLPYANANIGEKGIEKLVTYLANHPNIQSYNLASCALDGDSREVLLKALKIIKNHPSLQSIGLRVDHDDEVIDAALASIVDENQNLNFIDLSSLSSGNEVKKLNLVKFAKSLPLSKIQAFNHNGLRLSDEAFNNFIEGLRIHPSAMQVLQFGGQSLTSVEVEALAGIVQLPHSQIEQLVLPFSTIQKFFSGTALAIENMTLKSGSLKKLGFEFIKLDIESIRKLPEKEQVSALYDFFFQGLCKMQLQETLDVVLRWGPPIMGGKTEVSLSSQTLDLMGKTFYSVGAARYLPVLFNTFWQEEDVPALVEAWRGVGYFKGGDAVNALKSFTKVFAKDPSLTNSVFTEDGDLSKFLLGTFFEQVNPFVVKQDCYHVFARTHYALNKYQEATNWYDKAFRQEDRIVASDEHKQFLLEAGQSHFKAGNLTRAVEYFEHIMQNSSDTDFLDHINLGIAYFQQGKNEEAFMQYQQAIDKKPDSSDETYFAAAQTATKVKKLGKSC